MNNVKLMIFATKDHPLYQKLQQVEAKFYDIERANPFEERRDNYLKADYVFDFTILSLENKKRLLKALSIEQDCPIISDLSLNWADQILDQFPKVQGALSCVFPSPKDKYEFFANDDSIAQVIQTLLNEVAKGGVQTHLPGIGFTYPRVLSMIINEAFFALEEKLATREDIDTAMKFGVSYPLGPFEWAKKIGLKNIVTLLDELFRVTHDPRYRVASILRLEAQRS